MSKNINKALRMVRLHHGVSQKELAAKLGYSPISVCCIERGKVSASPKYVNKVISIFGIPRDRFDDFVVHLDCETDSTSYQGIQKAISHLYSSNAA